MLTFIARRLLLLIPVLFCVITITFFLIRLKPGGPFDKERKIPKAIEQQLLHKYRLDGPLWQQYGDYLGDVLHGNLRPSLKYRNWSVNEIIAQTLPVSATLGSLALLLAAVIGVSLGALAAVRQHHTADAAAMFFALVAISLPTFVTGPLLILVFCFGLHWLPVGGWDLPSTYILPVITLALPYSAYIARLMRGSLLEVLSQDYIRAARAKGLSEWQVVWNHGLRIAILPVLSFLGPLTANLLTGSIVVETIFQIPGCGRFFVASILNGDAFLLGGVTIIYCVLLVLMNLLVDVLQALLDKRIALT